MSEARSRKARDVVAKVISTSRHADVHAVLAWANWVLRPCSLPAARLSDFADGVRLHELIAQLFGRRVANVNQALALKAGNRVLMVQNVDAALTALAELIDMPRGVFASDLVGRSSEADTAMLDVLWAIARSWLAGQLIDAACLEQAAPEAVMKLSLHEFRKHLQQQLRVRLGPYQGLHARNLAGRSWRSGHAMLALVHRAVPSCVEYWNVADDTEMTERDVVQLALDLADTHLDVPRVLQAAHHVTQARVDQLPLLLWTALVLQRSQELAASEAALRVGSVSANDALEHVSDDHDDLLSSPRGRSPPQRSQSHNSSTGTRSPRSPTTTASHMLDEVPGRVSLHEDVLSRSAAGTVVVRRERSRPRSNSSPLSPGSVRRGLRSSVPSSGAQSHLLDRISAVEQQLADAVAAMDETRARVGSVAADLDLFIAQRALQRELERSRRISSVAPPTGTLTLVDALISGSSALWRALPPRMMGDAVKTVHQVYQRLLSQCNGYSVCLASADGVEHARFAFANPADAVNWCLRTQLALVDVGTWPHLLLQQAEAADVTVHAANVTSHAADADGHSSDAAYAPYHAVSTDQPVASRLHPFALALNGGLVSPLLEPATPSARKRLRTPASAAGSDSPDNQSGPGAASAAAVSAGGGDGATGPCCDSHASTDAAVLFRGLRIAMGVHTCEPACELDPVTGNMTYYGEAVDRTRRIATLCHGGQILVSDDTWHRVQDDLPGLGHPAAVQLGQHDVLADWSTFLIQLLPARLARRRFALLPGTSSARSSGSSSDQSASEPSPSSMHAAQQGGGVADVLAASRDELHSRLAVIEAALGQATDAMGRVRRDAGTGDASPSTSSNASSNRISAEVSAARADLSRVWERLRTLETDVQHSADAAVRQEQLRSQQLQAQVTQLQRQLEDTTRLRPRSLGANAAHPFRHPFRIHPV